MLFILEGNADIGAHEGSNQCYLICLINLIKSRAVTNCISPKRAILLHACATCSELPSSIMILINVTSSMIFF